MKEWKGNERRRRKRASEENENEKSPGLAEGSGEHRGVTRQLYIAQVFRRDVQALTISRLPRYVKLTTER